MSRDGFVITVEDAFKGTFNMYVGNELQPSVETGTYVIRYDVAKDVFIFCEFKGKDFKDWNGDFYLIIYTRIAPIFKQSSYQGKLIVPGDIVRSSIKAGLSMSIKKQHDDMRTPGNW
jgi:hypothetical protein